MRSCQEHPLKGPLWHRSPQDRRVREWQFWRAQGQGQGRGHSLRGPEPPVQLAQVAQSMQAGRGAGAPPGASGQPVGRTRRVAWERKSKPLRARPGRVTAVAWTQPELRPRAPSVPPVSLRELRAQPLPGLSPGRQLFRHRPPRQVRMTMPRAPRIPTLQRPPVTRRQLSWRRSSLPLLSLPEPFRPSAPLVADRESNLRAQPCGARGPLEHR